MLEAPFEPLPFAPPADFVLTPQRTALIVVDMQYASACRATGFGRWLREQGREEVGSYRFDRIETLVIPSIGQLLAFFRQHNLRRIFIRLGSQLSDCRDLAWQLQDLEAAFSNVAGNQEYEILEELAPQPGEPIVTKVTVSAFTSSGLDALLRNLDIRSLVITGVSTSHCVDLTARDAADRGYQTLVVEDAVAEDDPDSHEWTLKQFRRLFGRVAKADEVVAELNAQLNPARRA